jgi:hypothetical protein
MAQILSEVSKQKNKQIKKERQRFEYQGEKYKIGGMITPKVIKEIVTIQKSQGLTPTNLVERAKNKQSSLHNLFEWNDTIAGEKYRLHQAVNIINYIEVEVKGDLFPRYESVVITNGSGNLKREYYDNKQIISNEKLRKQMVQFALANLEGWKIKFQYYNELKPIVVSIDKTKKKLERKWKEK